MAAVRPLILGILAIGFLTGSSHADPINLGSWHFWYAGSSNSSTTPTSIFSSALTSPVVPSIQAAAPVVAAPSPVTPTVPTYSPPTVAAVAPVQLSLVASTAIASSPIASATPVNAFINFGNGPYTQASSITTGGGQAWYNSSAITSIFGGQPTTQQQQSFDAGVLQRIQQTFSQSGVNVTLTDNAATPALHSLSLVSNTVSSLLPTAIGMTNVGGSGFSFIDNIAPSASSLDQLEWIAAHNISHELMLAFGVGENYDQSGNYIDARNANWSMMTDPNSTFSSGAAQAINQALASQNAGVQYASSQAQVLAEAQVLTPEPSTILSWALALLATLFAHRRRLARRSTAA